MKITIKPTPHIQVTNQIRLSESLDYSRIYGILLCYKYKIMPGDMIWENGELIPILEVIKCQVSNKLFYRTKNGPKPYFDEEVFQWKFSAVDIYDHTTPERIGDRVVYKLKNQEIDKYRTSYQLSKIIKPIKYALIDQNKE